jgi:HAD superfamily hydrolase (TIGR01509 family)
MREYQKLVIFDLDGVLIDSREMHYHTLNAAIKAVALVPSYMITWEEHLSTYDGLPTRKKLELLEKNKGLPAELHSAIAVRKQRETAEYFLDNVQENTKLIIMMTKLKQLGYKIAVASNSVRETVRYALNALGLHYVVDFYISNEDVKRSKPYPEMYWRCMEAVGAVPKTTIIVEDSHIGREGALSSGATLLPVENATELSCRDPVSTSCCEVAFT